MPAIVMPAKATNNYQTTPSTAAQKYKRIKDLLKIVPT
jgi:hypothetical protein